MQLASSTQTRARVKAPSQSSRQRFLPDIAESLPNDPFTLLETVNTMRIPLLLSVPNKGSGCPISRAFLREVLP